MASLNRLKLPQKSNTYRNEYEFSETITKFVLKDLVSSYSFGQFVLILVNSYSFEHEYELTTK